MFIFGQNVQFKGLYLQDNMKKILLAVDFYQEVIAIAM
jgi:hypothetical protein